MPRLMLLLALTLITTACATTEDYQDWSSGEVGCDPEDIRISHVKSPALCGKTHTWIAECDGRKFRCANATGGDPCSNSIRCAEMKKRPRRAD